MMRLKAFGVIVALALGLLAAPLPAEAQQAGKVYRVGILRPAFGFVGSRPYDLFAFFLRELGYNAWLGFGIGLLTRPHQPRVEFELRYAVGTDEQLPELAAELVGLNVDVIVATGTLATRAAQQLTRTIPIVMVIDGDPVKAGLVATFARPGGNVTGVASVASDLGPKRLQLLTEAIPAASPVAVLWNPADPDSADEWRRIQTAAQRLGVGLQSLGVQSGDDLEAAFEAATRKRAGALLVLANRLNLVHWWAIVDLANKSRLPAMYPWRSFVAGLALHDGLMSYGPSRFDVWQRAASYVDKILKGAKPADLPVQRPIKFDLVINLRTAKTLGLTIPPSLLFQADRVIK